MNEKITKGQKTKQEIFEKADQLFSEKGYEATGVDEIVGALNLTSGVFYNYFNSKSDLLKQVVESKIDRSKELLLVVQYKESATQWVQRLLENYLSIEHRDSISKSCPITTLAQELIKLDCHESIGLTDYTKEFSEVLNRRLIMINPENAGKADAILGLCIGSLLLSRIEPDPIKSQNLLTQARKSALQMIEPRVTKI